MLNQRLLLCVCSFVSAVSLSSLAHAALSSTETSGGQLIGSAQTHDTVKDGIEQVIELTNADIERKYGRRAIAPSFSAIPMEQSSLGNVLIAHPIANSVTTSRFGYRTMGGRGENHGGIDLAAPTGTPIYATGNGTVIFSGWKNGYGNFVEIDHGNGLTTRYAHASRLLVSAGQQVTASEQIATVGSTGRSTGPHLHYEVRVNGKIQNPAISLAMAKSRFE